MRYTNLVMQVVGIAFLCLSISSTGFASRREELERAAELAVERAAERVAERAVEKALESGNSTTVTETIRASHSSVRKYDSTQQLPGFVYTPLERKEYERIMKEKEAAELAVAQIGRRHLFKRAIPDYRIPNNDMSNVNLYPVRTVRQLTYQLRHPVEYPFLVNNDNRAAIHQELITSQTAVQQDPREVDRREESIPLVYRKIYEVQRKPTIYYIPTDSKYPLGVQFQFSDQGIASTKDIERHKRGWSFF